MAHILFPMSCPCAGWISHLTSISRFDLPRASRVIREERSRTSGNVLFFFFSAIPMAYGGLPLLLEGQQILGYHHEQECLPSLCWQYQIFFCFFLPCLWHVKVPRRGLNPCHSSDPSPKPLQWQHQILNLLCHKGTQTIPAWRAPVSVLPGRVERPHEHPATIRRAIVISYIPSGFSDTVCVWGGAIFCELII